MWLLSKRTATARMTQVRTAAKAGSQSGPRAVATPTAAVTQMVAAVVRPCTSPRSASFRILPAPRKPIPETMTCTNDVSHALIIGPHVTPSAWARRRTCLGV
jgi:hypothetical protein